MRSTCYRSARINDLLLSAAGHFPVVVVFVLSWNKRLSVSLVIAAIGAAVVFEEFLLSCVVSLVKPRVRLSQSDRCYRRSLVCEDVVTAIRGGEIFNE